MAFSKVQEAIDSIGRLGMAVVVDDEDRENEGDLVMAAEAATPENIAFFLAHTSGVICVPLLPERADALDLPLMVTANTEAQRTAFTVSVDFRHGTTTGISATDRVVDHRRPDRPGHSAQRPEPARSHLPVALPDRWRAQARRAHGGHGGPGPRRRAHTGRRAVRDRDRGQVRDGAARRSRDLRQEARSPLHLDRGPDPLPPAEREAGASRLRGAHPRRGTRVPRLRLRVRAGQRAAPGARHGRCGGHRGRAGPCPLRVPDR